MDILFDAHNDTSESDYESSRSSSSSVSSSDEGADTPIGANQGHPNHHNLHQPHPPTSAAGNAFHVPAPPPPPPGPYQQIVPGMPSADPRGLTGQIENGPSGYSHSHLRGINSQTPHFPQGPPHAMPPAQGQGVRVAQEPHVPSLGEEGHDLSLSSGGHTHMRSQGHQGVPQVPPQYRPAGPPPPSLPSRPARQPGGTRGEQVLPPHLSGDASADSRSRAGAQGSAGAVRSKGKGGRPEVAPPPAPPPRPPSPNHTQAGKERTKVGAGGRVVHYIQDAGGKGGKKRRRQHGGISSGSGSSSSSSSSGSRDSSSSSGSGSSSSSGSDSSSDDSSLSSDSERNLSPRNKKRKASKKTAPPHYPHEPSPPPAQKRPPPTAKSRQQHPTKGPPPPAGATGRSAAARNTGGKKNEAKSKPPSKAAAAAAQAEGLGPSGGGSSSRQRARERERQLTHAQGGAGAFPPAPSAGRIDAYGGTTGSAYPPNPQYPPPGSQTAVSAAALASSSSSQGGPVSHVYIGVRPSEGLKDADKQGTAVMPSGAGAGTEGETPAAAAQAAGMIDPAALVSDFRLPADRMRTIEDVVKKLRLEVDCEGLRPWLEDRSCEFPSYLSTGENPSLDEADCVQVESKEDETMGVPSDVSSGGGGDPLSPSSSAFSAPPPHAVPVVRIDSHADFEHHRLMLTTQLKPLYNRLLTSLTRNCDQFKSYVSLIEACQAEYDKLKQENASGTCTAERAAEIPAQMMKQAEGVNRARTRIRNTFARRKGDLVACRCALLALQGMILGMQAAAFSFVSRQLPVQTTTPTGTPPTQVLSPQQPHTQMIASSSRGHHHPHPYPHPHPHQQQLHLSLGQHPSFPMQTVPSPSQRLHRFPPSALS